MIFEVQFQNANTFVIQTGLKLEMNDQNRKCFMKSVHWPETNDIDKLVVIFILNSVNTKHPLLGHTVTLAITCAYEMYYSIANLFIL